MKLLITALLVLLAPAAHAASYFVESGRGEEGLESVASKTTSLVVDRVKLLKGDQLANNTQGVDFVLQPRVKKVGAAYVVSIEASKEGHRVAFGEAKAAKIEDLDKAVAQAMDQVTAKKGAGHGPAPKNLKMAPAVAPENAPAQPAVPPEAQRPPGAPGQTSPAAPVN